MSGPPGKRTEFWVYVVELDPSRVPKSGVKGAVYVGETALAPEERFERHMSGERVGAKVVTRAGVRLRPDLAPTSAFLSREAALRAEARTRRRLRNRGFHVYGGQGEPFMASSEPED